MERNYCRDILGIQDFRYTHTTLRPEKFRVETSYICSNNSEVVHY